MFDLNDYNNTLDLKSQNIKILLDKILTYIKTIINADAGTIYLKDDNNNLKFTAFQNDSLDYDCIFDLERILYNIEIPIKEGSQILAIESFILSHTIMIDDIYNDNIYDFHTSKEFDKTFSYTTKSILSTPLVNFYTNEKIGVLQLINKKNDFNENISFTKEDEKLIYISSYLITLNITYTQDLISKLENVNMNLEYKIKQRTQELERIQIELLNQVNRDPMTNLYNRRYFNDVINNLVKISKRQSNPLSISMIDIDNFKKINDRYGHDVGDIVINKLSDIFRKIVRNSDIIVRFGGEEFIIIFPNTNLDDAKIISNKIRQFIEDDTINLDNGIDINFTISAGISILNIEDIDITNALKNADKALYISKNNGKNQVNIEI